MATQEERRAKTREELLNAATLLFGQQGFTDTTMDQVVQRAGVAKGALYHHFATKQVLFETLYERECAQVATAVVSALPQPAGQLNAEQLMQLMLGGVRRFFELCARAETAQIVLKDGPAVLGWQRWREIDAQHFGGVVAGVLQLGLGQGLIKDQPVAPLAQMLLGAISEAALVCANEDDFGQAAEQYLASIEGLLRGLLA